MVIIIVIVIIAIVILLYEYKNYKHTNIDIMERTKFELTFKPLQSHYNIALVDWCLKRTVNTEQHNTSY